MPGLSANRVPGCAPNACDARTLARIGCTICRILRDAAADPSTSLNEFPQGVRRLTTISALPPGAYGTSSAPTSARLPAGLGRRSPSKSTTASDAGSASPRAMLVGNRWTAEANEPLGSTNATSANVALRTSVPAGVLAGPMIEKLCVQATPNASTSVLVGCTYARGALPVAKDAVSATSKVVGGNVCLAKECCGLPLLLAGDAEGFKAQAERFAASVKGKRELVVVDAGCAMALRVRYAEVGVSLEPRVEHFLERAMSALGRMKKIGNGEKVRYHDPCQLSRGLGVVEPPRSILTKLLGEAPLEFPNNRGKSVCSGGGGLVPVTMPEAAKTMAKTRTDEHKEAGGGKIVTACASSLLQFRRAGAEAEDIATWIDRGLT